MSKINFHWGLEIHTRVQSFLPWQVGDILTSQSARDKKLRRPLSSPKQICIIIKYHCVIRLS
jgi:hypothetical protein